MSWRIICALCAGGLLAAPLRAADEPPVDADFLEFLGTVDSNDADWRDYLAQSELDGAATAHEATDVSTPHPATPKGKEEQP